MWVSAITSKRNPICFKSYYTNVLSYYKMSKSQHVFYQFVCTLFGKINKIGLFVTLCIKYSISVQNFRNA